MAKAKLKNVNALKHGAFSKAFVIEDEDPSEFQALRKELVRDWRPEGASQREYVLAIAMWMWRRRRVTRLAGLLLSASLQAGGKVSPDRFYPLDEKTCLPLGISKEIEVGAYIDCELDKAIRRLIQLKASQQTLKSFDSDPVTNRQLYLTDASRKAPSTAERTMSTNVQ